MIPYTPIMPSLVTLSRRRVLFPGQAAAIQVIDEVARPALESVARLGTLLEGAAIGTEAEVLLAVPRPNGLLTLHVVGRRRFRRDVPTPTEHLFDARVAFLDEHRTPVDGDLRARVEAELRRYLAAAAESGEGGNIHVELAADPWAASYEIGATMRVSEPERQELLEVDTVADRLEKELTMLQREGELLRRLLAMGRMGP